MSVRMKGQALVQQTEPMIAQMQGNTMQKPKNFTEQRVHQQTQLTNFDGFWQKRAMKEVTVVKKSGERITGLLRAFQTTHGGVILIWKDEKTQKWYNRFFRGDTVDEILIEKTNQNVRA
jgi:hypothetical protein